MVKSEEQLRNEWETEAIRIAERFATGLRSPDMIRFETLLRDASRRRFFEAHGIVEQPLGESPLEVRALRESILSQIEAMQALPSLPAIVAEVNRALEDPNSDAKTVAGILTLDPGLVTGVLRLVNSPIFALRSRVESIEHAVAMLGFVEVRNLVMATSVSRLFSIDAKSSFDATRFWEHSLSVAIGSRLVAATLKEEGRPAVGVEDAFLAGLLHDVGKIVVAQHFAEPYEQTLELSRETGVSLYDAELAVLGVHHTEIGQLLLESWDINSDITTAAADHHGLGARGSLAYTVHLADLISHGLGFGAEQVSIPRHDPAVWTELDLSDAAIGNIVYRVLVDLDQVRGLLGLRS